MAIVSETKLPGVGVRQEFVTAQGNNVGVLQHHDGRRDIMVYDVDDPDRCSSILHLDSDDTRTLASLLGASQITESMGVVQQEVEGLAFEWMTLPADSVAVGATIGDGMYRTKTGCSVVAVLRSGTSIPAPGPDFGLEAGDTLVAVGTADGLDTMRALVIP
ncbi:MAG: potassium transporter TrkA [Acidimicrobiaceae bacterium]|nr:potassium transporter TrkA [Acidimicrobiaceae bacterium]